MLSAGRLGNRCSRCRQDLLALFESSLAGSVAPRRAPTQLRTASCSSSLQTRKVASPRHRCFSTTSASRQSPNAAEKPTETEAKDNEAFARRAKETFGDTLPAGYLSPEEYKVYERLYGPPLRETQPEDVGIRFLRETEVGTALLRETEDGQFEEVEYMRFRHGVADVPEAKDVPWYDPSIPVDEEAALHDLPPEFSTEGVEPLQPLDHVSEGALSESLEVLPEEGEISTEVPDDPRLAYLHITPRNKREYKALIKLQADFEAASLRAVAEEEAKAAAAAEAEQAASEQSGYEQLEELEALEAERAEAEAARNRELERWESQDQGQRLHPLTVQGKFGTSPTTIQLPKEKFVKPIADLLKRTDPVHIKQAAEEVFGGPGLRLFSARIPLNMKNVAQKGVALEATHQRMSPINADAYIATVLPTVYASVMSTLAEVRKRLGTAWLHDLMAKNDGKGPSVLDVGGAGAGLLAWQHVMDAEWEAQGGHEEGAVPPRGKKTAVVASDFLRHRVSAMLDDTTFLPRLPDYLHLTQDPDKFIDATGNSFQRKKFDVIIMPHMLMPLDKSYRRKQLVDNVWEMLNPEGGLLIVLEKGHPRGFEAVADVRSRILREFIVPPGAQLAETQSDGAIELDSARVREPGMIVAPCTNHKKCPMYHIPGYTHGRRDFCHFSQRFIRPPFLQHVLGGKHENHEDVNFSYIAVQRGSTGATEAAMQGAWQGKEARDRAYDGYEDIAFGGRGGKGEDAAEAGSSAVSMFSLPRNVLPPIKGKGHVQMDMCTPAGTLERWTIPRSYGKQAYYDARKARWGDLWALGAKTREIRRIRLGRAAAQAEADRKADKKALAVDEDVGIDENDFDAEETRDPVALANITYPLGPPASKLKALRDQGVRARSALDQSRKPSRIELGVGKTGIESAIEKFADGMKAHPGRRSKNAHVKSLLEDLEKEVDNHDDEDQDMGINRRLLHDYEGGNKGGDGEGRSKRNRGRKEKRRSKADDGDTEE